VNATSEANFKAATQSLLEFWHRKFGVPVVIAGLHKWYTGSGMGTESDWNNVRSWQQDIANAYSWASFVDLSDVDGNPSDRIHLDVTGNSTAGSRISTALSLVV